MISIPDLKGRYALFPMLDGWTDIFQVPGKRTTGTGAQKYAITGPGWSGTLPAGVTENKLRTRNGLAAWSYLLHRHAGGLQSGTCAAGPNGGSAAIFLWQGVYADAGSR